MTADEYRLRAPAEFETPWLRLGLSPAQRRPCILAGLALSAIAAAAAAHAYRNPARAHPAVVVISCALGAGLLAAGWPPEDVFPADAR